MKWMDAAWAEEGQAEVPGPAANPRIIQFFADIGLPGIKSDEVANCGAFVGACLVRAGVSIDAIPVDDRALARSYLKIGTEIDGPRVGAVAVLPRGASSWQGHTGFVTAFDAKRVRLLGANQGDKVCEAWFKRDGELGYRWPEQPKAPKQIASRIVAAASDQKKDGALLTTTVVADKVRPEPTLDSVVQAANSAKGAAQTLEAFTMFAASKMGWILGAFALFFIFRMVWNSGVIQWLRAEDHNTGKNVGRT